MFQFWLTAVSWAAALVSAVDFGEYDAQAQTIVNGFSTAQLLGQMTQLTLSEVMDENARQLNESAVRHFAQLHVGSYLNIDWDGPINGTYGYNASEFRSIIQRIQDISMEENGGHPILYGLDSVHGANYVDGAVLMPQQINSGASFNPDLVYEVGRITARDTMAAGIPWMFGPIVDLSQNKLWARTFETFSEDTYLVSVMGAAIVRGLQSYNQTAACLKHFIAYSKTPAGHDRDNVLVSDFELYNHYLPPYKLALEAGALTVMENYISLNGAPVVSSSKILNNLLRTDLTFNGVLVTDWNEIYNLHDFHRVSASREEAVATALKETSIDISMVPQDTDFITYGLNMLKTNPEQEDRLRQSVHRVVKLKLQLGLYDTPVPGAEHVSTVGSDEDRKVALEMARESIVLLKNQDNVLPLSKNASVFLTGPSADNVGLLCGGWTKRWQGYSGNEMFPKGISIRQGMVDLVGNSSFSYFNGLQVDGTISDADMAQAVRLAGQHEYTIAAIGEHSYAEKPGDLDDLALPEGQVNYIKALAATGTKVIVVLVEGRPRLVRSIPNNAAAIIDAMLPCELGGQALAEIIYGDVNPSGKLPITYPKDHANVAIPYNHLVSTTCQYGECAMEWNFGTGLSYTQFNYSSVALDKRNITNAADTLTATVTVTNVGNRVGKETVMLFLIQPFRKISVPEVKMLKKFKKIELQAGESQAVSFTLSMEDWGVYKPEFGKGLTKTAEDSDYVVAIKPDTNCNVYENITSTLCALFNINTSGGSGTANSPGTVGAIQM